MTPDNLPVYQQSERYPGAFVVTCHSGVTLASLHALELPDAILAGKLPAEIGAFTVGRFHV
jgi:glycine/D-amino acid oxidase-like deaminating enzyme